MSASMLAWVKRHQLVAYFVLACAISWILVSPLIASGLGLTPARIPNAWHALGALGPLLAAFGVTALVAGKRGVARLLASMGRWRVGIGWFLAAVLSPFILFAGTAVLLRATGAPWPDFGQLPSRFADSAWLLGAFVASAIYGLGEEPGWRGFALPRLQQRWSALAASSILAIFWALWHAAYFTYRYHLSIVEVVFFFLGILAGSIWLTCLYNSTRGSVLMAILWHVSFNMATAIAAVVSTAVLSLLSVEVVIAAIVIVLVWKPARLSPAPKHTLLQEEPSAPATLESPPAPEQAGRIPAGTP